MPPTVVSDNTGMENKSGQLRQTGARHLLQAIRWEELTAGCGKQKKKKGGTVGGKQAKKRP